MYTIAQKGIMVAYSEMQTGIAVTILTGLVCLLHLRSVDGEMMITSIVSDKLIWPKILQNYTVFSTRQLCLITRWAGILTHTRIDLIHVFTEISTTLTVEELIVQEDIVKNKGLTEEICKDVFMTMLI